MKGKKFLIIGHKRHGKDTFAEMLRDIHGLKFESSSMAAARIFIFDELKDKYGYGDINECFEDRVNHRAEWFDLITDYNKKDPARLAKIILNNSDCYVGMRSHVEIKECLDTGVIDFVIWVHDERKPLEDSSSFDIDCNSLFDVKIHNNKGLEELRSLAKDFPMLIDLCGSEENN